MNWKKTLAAGALACAGMRGQSGIVVGGATPVANADAAVKDVVSTPVLGYAASRTGNTIQVLTGIAGTAAAGPVTDTGIPASLIRVSAQRVYALGAARNGGSAFLFRLRTGETVRLPVTGASRIAISPAGTSAVFYAPAAHALYVFTGLPDAGSPRVIDAGWMSDPVSLAVSDDGAAVLAATDGEQSAVYLLNFDRTPANVRPGSRASAISFVESSHDAVVAELPNRVVVLRDGGAAGAETIADGSVGVSEPADVAVSHDGRRVFVANAGSGNILEIGLGTQTVRSATCACRPSQLQRLAGDEVFLITSQEGSLFVFDTGSDGPRVTSVVPTGNVTTAVNAVIGR